MVVLETKGAIEQWEVDAVQMVIIDGHTIPSAAKQIGLSTGSIWHALRRYGFRHVPRGKPKEKRPRDFFSYEQTVSRILNKVRVGEGCWEWIGARNPNGYGWTSWKGRGRWAHRVIWEICFGPIPEGLIICHKCDNPPCVNPDHLFLGTHKDNTQDSIRKGRWNANRGRAAREKALARRTEEERRARRLKQKRDWWHKHRGKTAAA